MNRTLLSCSLSQAWERVRVRVEMFEALHSCSHVNHQ
jgi:hypothetical protein